ncbi:MAG: hypothetical protein JXB46_04650 [Candidatus Eisenbacteria bacterium]|nr:hypothetical protein [Candidatus Eisenbacteria bacterium]
MTKRLEKRPLPDPAYLRRLLSERVGEICEGGRLVDADARGPTGVDLVVADEEGRPVFVDVVLDDPRTIPSRAFEHLRWFEDNRRLFLRAYSRDGVVRTEDPVFVFVSEEIPDPVLAAVGSMDGVPVRLISAECYSVLGEIEILLEDVTPESAGGARRQSGDGNGTSTRDASRPHERIESQPVRGLLGLFTSGVDGLDGRIEATETRDRISFTLGERVLAEVGVSPASFTVSPGDSLVNPIVVSDRVSLERALNAVVSLFVREEATVPEVGVPDGTLTDQERAALAEIWGAGVSGSKV